MEAIEPLESIYEITETLIAKYGAAGIGLAMFSESAGVPFASAIVLLSAGPLILRGSLSFWVLWVSSTIGITLGSIFSYGLGLLSSIVSKKVRRNFFKKKPYHHQPESHKKTVGSRLLALWDKYGNFSIFMAQLWGVTRTFVSFPAGAMHMNIHLFILYTFLGGAIYSLIAIATSIALTGTMGLTIKLLKLLAGFSPWLLLIPFLILAGLLLFIYLRRQRKRAGV